MLITVFPKNYFGARHVGKSCLTPTRKQGCTEKLLERSQLPLVASWFSCMFYFNPLQNGREAWVMIILQVREGSAVAEGSVTYPGLHNWWGRQSQIFLIPGLTFLMRADASISAHFRWKPCGELWFLRQSVNAGLRQVKKQRDSFSGKQGTGTDTGLLKFILGGHLESCVGGEVPWFPRLRMFNAGWRQGGAVCVEGSR